MALSSGCAATGLNSTEGWKAVQSKHITLYTNTSQLYSTAMRTLENSNAAMASSFFFNDVNVGQIEVLFLEEDDFAGLMGYKRSSVALAKVPGNGKIGQKGLLIVKNDPGGDSHAEALAHLYLHTLMPKAPLWFHDGFAAYSRSAELRKGDGQSVACFGNIGGGEDTLIPLKDLFSLSWDAVDEGPRAWYKYTARTLFDYLVHGENGENGKKIGVVAQGVLDGKPGADILAEVFPGVPPDAVNEKVKGHASTTAFSQQGPTKARGLCPVPFVVPAEKAPDQGERQTAPVDAADMQALIDALNKLPRRDDGVPAWYPPDIIARAERAPAAAP